MEREIVNEMHEEEEEEGEDEIAEVKVRSLPLLDEEFINISTKDNGELFINKKSLMDLEVPDSEEEHHTGVTTEMLMWKELTILREKVNLIGKVSKLSVEKFAKLSERLSELERQNIKYNRGDSLRKRENASKAITRLKSTRRTRSLEPSKKKNIIDDAQH